MALAVPIAELDELAEFAERHNLRRLRVGDVAFERAPAQPEPTVKTVSVAEFREQIAIEDDWDDWSHTDGRPRRKDEE